MRNLQLFPEHHERVVPLRKYWLAVASAEHVRIGRAAGFMQVCHGKRAPLRRIHPGDVVVYYSPSEVFGSRAPLQALTAIGEVLSGEPYQVQMGADFYPYRRDVGWWPAQEASIRPLLPKLLFAAGQNWGYQLRFGLYEVAESDMQLMAAAIGANWPESWGCQTQQA